MPTLSNQQIKDFVNGLISQYGSIERAAPYIFQAGIQYGVSPSQLDAAMGWAEGTSLRYSNANPQQVNPQSSQAAVGQPTSTGTTLASLQAAYAQPSGNWMGEDSNQWVGTDANYRAALDASTGWHPGAEGYLPKGDPSQIPSFERWLQTSGVQVGPDGIIKGSADNTPMDLYSQQYFQSNPSRRNNPFGLNSFLDRGGGVKVAQLLVGGAGGGFGAAEGGEVLSGMDLASDYATSGIGGSGYMGSGLPEGVGSTAGFDFSLPVEEGGLLDSPAGSGLPAGVGTTQTGLTLKEAASVAKDVVTTGSAAKSIHDWVLGPNGEVLDGNGNPVSAEDLKNAESDPFTQFLKSFMPSKPDGTTNWASILGTIGATGLGMYSSNQMANTLQKLSDQNRADRAPYLAASQGYLADPASYGAGPGLAAAKNFGGLVGAKMGNPAQSGLALQLGTDAGLKDWREAVTGFGNMGLSGADTRANLGMAQAGAQGDVYSNLAGGVSNLLNPPSSLEELLRGLSKYKKAGVFG